MQLLIIRHGRAEERDDFARSGQPDELRPLTDEGRKRLRQGLPALTALAPRLALLVSSPLVRARQTAEEIQHGYPGVAIEESDLLTPGTPPAALAEWLQRQRETGTVAIVGHEPDLGFFAGWLLGGSHGGALPFKKGGAGLLELDDRIAPGSATLTWFLGPRHLRQLGKAVGNQP